MSALAARGDSRRKVLEATLVPVAVAHVLAIAGWVSATVITRRLRGDDFHPIQVTGVFGWMSWDAGFYRSIANHGYPAHQLETVRFFPLYPLLGRIVRPLVGGNTDLALLIVAKVALVVGLFGIYRLVRHEGGSARLARTTIWVLVLFPGAFVLTWGYSEALLLALAVWCIYGLRTGRYALAIATGVAAGLCRPVGIALAAAAFVELIRCWPTSHWRVRAARLATIAAPGLGLVAFLAYSARRGFGMWTPLSIQDEFRHTQDPLQRMLAVPHDLFGTDAFKSGLHVPFVALFLVLLVVVFRRLPASYGAFAVFVMVMALSAQNLNSVERYGMGAFPLAMAVAMLIDRDERLQFGTLAVGGAMMTTLTTLALCGAYVP